MVENTPTSINAKGNFKWPKNFSKKDRKEKWSELFIQLQNMPSDAVYQVIECFFVRFFI